MDWTHDQLSAKKWEGQPFDTLQWKENGWRVTFFRQHTPRRVVGYGKDRQGDRHTSRPDLEFLKRFPRLCRDPVVDQIRFMPPYSSVDCEIVTEEGVNSSVITALKDPKIPIKIRAFGTPWFAGEDLSKSPMSVAEEICTRYNIPFIEWFTKAQLVKIPIASAKDLDDVREDLLSLVRQKNKEGFVLKHGGQCGKWYKLKASPTCDCIAMGVVMAEPGKFQGMIGSVRLGVLKDGKIIEVCTCSGMTDGERANITGLHMDGLLVNQVIEVKYQFVGAKGRLISPRFVRFRPDKQPRQCVYDQLLTGA